MTTTPTPHDCFFRENFARPIIARDFLQHQLPAALLAELDLDGLTISPDTFMTEALRNEQQARTLLEHRFSGEPLMETFIDRYLAQGEQRGIQLGEQRGRATTLLCLIERKFGPPSEQHRERITQADSDTLLQWSERILDARSLDDVLH